MPQTKPIISIENVVASATVDQKMDLNDITKKFPDVEYHPDQFPGLVFRLKSPKTATLIFTSGKMVCTGAKSEQMSKNAVKTVVEKLRKGKIKVKKNAVVTIQNIVASINLGGRIHLEQAARTLPRSMYEPEQFPGLIHRMLDPKTVILLFSSGALFVQVQKEEDVYCSVNNLHALLEEKINGLRLSNYLIFVPAERHHLQLAKMVYHQYQANNIAFDSTQPFFRF